MYHSCQLPPPSTNKPQVPVGPLGAVCLLMSSIVATQVSSDGIRGHRDICGGEGRKKPGPGHPGCPRGTLSPWVSVLPKAPQLEDLGSPDGRTDSQSACLQRRKKFPEQRPSPTACCRPRREVNPG